jgi:predicted  nucleic acid-binding Zn-ribbon protein
MSATPDQAAREAWHAIQSWQYTQTNEPPRVQLARVVADIQRINTEFADNTNELRSERERYNQEKDLLDNTKRPRMRLAEIDRIHKERTEYFYKRGKELRDQASSAQALGEALRAKVVNKRETFYDFFGQAVGNKSSQYQFTDSKEPLRVQLARVVADIQRINTKSTENMKELRSERERYNQDKKDVLDNPRMRLTEEYEAHLKYKEREKYFYKRDEGLCGQASSAQARRESVILQKSVILPPGCFFSQHL